MIIPGLACIASVTSSAPRGQNNVHHDNLDANSVSQKSRPCNFCPQAGDTSPELGQMQFSILCTFVRLESLRVNSLPLDSLPASEAAISPALRLVKGALRQRFNGSGAGEGTTV